MDVSDILLPLNTEQRAAVTADRGTTLVLAGAGSGKTRVLVHRVAWLMRVDGVSPHGLLAVTFTNKAAAEMRARIEDLLGVPVGGMWVGTFHGLAHRLLRAHWQDAGLPQTFQILDSDDQYRLIRRILKNLDLDEARWPPREIQGFINARKDEALRPQHIPDADHPVQRHLVRVYAAYQEACDRGGLVDFAELLLRAHELWREHPDILAHYQGRFRCVLVDEFQDTNAIQYGWLRLLSGDEEKLFVVGDDDQSIYGWRGARVEHIQKLLKDFPGARLLRLERNYRSTSTILDAANALIANNPSRLGKNLWTEIGSGEPISVYAAYNEVDEARYVADRIRQAVEQDVAPGEVAVLYRSNAQSRLFEEALIQAGIPYRVYGGLRFFERAEIKDALAYLRLVANRDDDPSFERVVNMPTRGIGNRTLDAIRDAARRHRSSLWAAAVSLVRGDLLPARARTCVRGFLDLVDALSGETDGLELADQVQHVIACSGLQALYEKDRSEKGQDRRENLAELVNATRQFVFQSEDDLDPLSSFLSHAALESRDTQGDAHQSSVQLMTLHAAKGLEFPMVFICGMEEGLFPSRLSVDEPGRLEEERRLCYVGMTRAMRQLYLCYAETRRLYGNETYPAPSRFLRELPPELLRDVRPRPQLARPATGFGGIVRQGEETGLRLGQRVLHPKFGDGVVLNFEGNGPSTRVQVNFEAVGSKWLVVAYANLQPVA